MMAPSASHACTPRTKHNLGDESDAGSSSSSSSSSVDAEGDLDDAALLWLENLLPLPLPCSVMPAEFPLPQSMNSRILAVSPGDQRSALLGYVQLHIICIYAAVEARQRVAHANLAVQRHHLLLASAL